MLVIAGHIAICVTFAAIAASDFRSRSISVLWLFLAGISALLLAFSIYGWERMLHNIMTGVQTCALPIWYPAGFCQCMLSYLFQGKIRQRFRICGFRYRSWRYSVPRNMHPSVYLRPVCMDDGRLLCNGAALRLRFPIRQHPSCRNKRIGVNGNHYY